MIWMKTGKLADTHADTTIRRRGSFFAGPRSRTNCVRDQFADVDCSRLRTVCGQFTSAAVACSRTIEAVACAWTRTVCGRDCWRGLNCGHGLFADTDNSLPRPGWGLFKFADGRVCGHGQLILRGYFAHLSRLTRGLKSLSNQGVRRVLS